ncbi:MAG: hypothetical protein AAFV53_02480 [Myxococcota bacterium]
MSEHHFDDKSRNALEKLKKKKHGNLASFYFTASADGETAGLVVMPAGHVDGGGGDTAGARGGKLRKQLKTPKFCRGLIIRTAESPLAPQKLYFERHGGNLSAKAASKIIGQKFFKSVEGLSAKILKKVRIHDKGGLEDPRIRSTLGLDSTGVNEAMFQSGLAALQAAEGLDAEAFMKEQEEIVAAAEADLSAAETVLGEARAAMQTALSSWNPLKIAKAARKLAKARSAARDAQRRVAAACETGTPLLVEGEGEISLSDDVRSMVGVSRSLAREQFPNSIDEIDESTLISVVDDILAEDAPVKTMKSRLLAATRAFTGALDIKKHIYNAILRADTHRKTKILEAMSDVPNQDVVYEQLARNIYSMDLSEDNEQRVWSWGYEQVARVDDASSGFAARAFAPRADVDASMEQIHGRELVPLLVFTGTNDKQDVYEDMVSQGVGHFQMAKHMGNIKMMFEACGDAKCDIIGHSLGGALAQLCAIRFADRVRRVVTYQSPGIDAGSAAKMADYNATHDEPIDSTHYVARGDVVSRAGEDKTEGTVYHIDKVGIPNPMTHTDRLITDLATIRNIPLPGFKQKKGKEAQDTIIGIRTEESGTQQHISFFETVRKNFGKLFKGANQKSKAAELWNNLVELAERSMDADQFSLEKIEKLIDIQDIPEEMKGQFKANFRVLYDEDDSDG